MNYKYILAFAAGVGAGIGGTLLAVRKKLKGQQSVLDFQRQQIEELENALKAETQKAEPIAALDGDKIFENLHIHDEADEADDLRAPYVSDAPEEDAGEEMDIYAIGIADFMQDAEYDKKYLTYYRGDKTLVDEAEERIDDPAKLIGDMLELLEMGGMELETMYVRNTRTKTDIQIDVMQAPFGEEER